MSRPDHPRSSSLLLLFLTAATVLVFHPTMARGAGAIRGAYYPSWRFSTDPPSSIQVSLFTHVFYAFANPDPTTFQLAISADDDRMLSNFTASLHGRQPEIKTLLSLGGGGGPGVYAKIVSSPSSRSAFIASTISVARKYGLDGMDLDWESPQNQEEMTNLGILFQEWRAAFTKEASDTGRTPLLLTAAVYFASSFFLSDNKRPFPIPVMRETLDFINVMNYDYHGGWDTSATGAHAALFDPKSNISTRYGLSSWVRDGMPREKIVMGLPVYGRSWTLKDPNDHGIGSPAVAVGPGEKDGTMIYSKIVEFNKANKATEVYDEVNVAEYSYVGTTWIGYDGPTSTEVKVRYAKGMEIGGYFFWALTYDQDWVISNAAYDAWGNQ